VIALSVGGCGLFAAAAPFSLVKVADVTAPTAIVAPRQGPDVIFVAEQSGIVRRLAGGVMATAMDIRDRVDPGGEKGLLGIALHPSFPADSRIFVNYTYKLGKQLRTRIASFRCDAQGATCDPASELEILSFDQPWSNHNSGSMAFGPDGMLYLGVGDGGSAGDPRATGQDPSDWLGSILRIDVSATPYRVPPDNPKIPGAAPEVWAYGLRNPWGMHFDGKELYWADVGQNTYEELDRGVAGGNYGWNRKEAGHCFKVEPCPGAFVEPIAEYDHWVGSSITGGPVYRGPGIPTLDGKVVFADFTEGKIFVVPPSGGRAELVADTEMLISAFGVDRAGRLYIGDYKGALMRVDASR
jgi:glucose/arabinose dehydrogenase